MINNLPILKKEIEKFSPKNNSEGFFIAMIFCLIALKTKDEKLAKLLAIDYYNNLFSQKDFDAFSEASPNFIDFGEFAEWIHLDLKENRQLTEENIKYYTDYIAKFLKRSNL